MKKIALCSLAVFAYTISNSFAADRCIESAKNVHLARGSSQQVWDDEFLFTNGREYSSLKNLGRANVFTKNGDDIKTSMLTEGYTLGSGHVLECDDDSCRHGVFAFLPNRGWGRGDVTSGEAGTVFKCTTSGDDAWMIQNVIACPENTKIQRTEHFYEATDSRVVDIATSTDYFVMSKDVNSDRDSLCKCSGDRIFNVATNTCVCKDSNAKWTGKKCEPAVKQCTYEGKKYNIGATIKNGVPCSEATDADSKTGKTCLLTCMEQLANKGGAAINKWSVKECPDNATKVIDYSLPEQIYTATIPGHKKCEFGKVPGKKPVQTSTNCTYAFRVKCTNGTEVTGLTGYPIVVNYNQTSLKSVQAKYGLSDDEIKQCVNNKALDNSNTLYVKMWNVDNNDFANKLKTDAALNKQILNFCASHGGYNGEDNGGNANPVIYNHDATVVGPDATIIKNAQNVLSAFTARAKSEASGWKTEDGKFNTMRLASDLSAGVVLGTVGGVVSGVVIKKKQVEKGFDALHCTVGGQTIADWGDTFSVGLQR